MQRCLAAAYIRVSTEEQAELSPESQLEEIRRYAERENFQLLEDHIYVDSGISGKKAGNRPEFMRMISVAKNTSCPFSVILLWKYSRFARNQEESIFYKSILRSRCGIDVISVTEPLIDGPFGSLIERIIEWMDEFYSIRLSQEVKRSMKVNAERGKLQCPAAYGYYVANGKLIEDENESKYVKRIFKSFNAGKGMCAIAREINDAGARTHRGNRFESRTVEYILRNPVYIGRLRWNPNGHTGRNFSNPGIIVSEGEHKPIVSIADFEAAQRRLDRTSRSAHTLYNPSGKVKSWVSGIVRCSRCGATMVYSNPYYMRCGNYVRGRCQSSQHIRVDLLESALLSLLISDSRTVNPLQFELIEQKEAVNEEQSFLEASLRASYSRRKRLRDIYLAGEVEIEEFSRLNHQIETEIEQALDALDRFEAKHSHQNKESVKDQASSAAVQAFEPSNYDVKAVNKAIQAAIEKCSFDKENMTLVVIYRANF